MISVQLNPGTYVVAVSGGVDSMALLEIVRRLPDVRLIVAHVNHGIRSDADGDGELVRGVAMSHNLAYVETHLYLGRNASEDVAREARYKFLRHTCKEHNALAILTAHHKDDLIETAIINMLRGTGWRGLSSLRSTPDTIRPLLDVTKDELQEYAEQHSLQWRHDSTNDDMRYLRNRVRRQLLPKMSPDQRQELYEYIVRQNNLTATLDHEVASWIDQHCTGADSPARLPRYELIVMSQHVAHEILQNVLRRKSGKSMTRPLAERALLFTKVAKAHKVFPINSRWQLRALTREVIVERTPLVLS